MSNTFTVEGTFVDELRKFAESTSVRGIPRVFKSSNRGLVGLWLMAVIVCSGLLLWQLSTVIMRYYSFEIVTGISEAGYNTVFPDITMCKINQLNTLYTDYVNYSDYISESMSRKARWPLNRVNASFSANVTEKTYERVWSHFLSNNGYYNSLPLDVSLTENDEARKNPFVIYCYASMWDESTPWDCSGVVQLVWHRKYYKCQSLQLPDSMRRAVKSVAIILYLNNFDQPATRDGCCFNADRSQGSGIRLSVHDHGVSTDMARGVAVSPGTEATLSLTESDRSRLSAPYGNCTKASFLGEPSDNKVYSVHGCKQLCLQNTSISTCQCIDLQNIYTAAQLHSVNNVICGNQTPANVLDDSVLSPEEDLRAFKTVHCLFACRKPTTEDCACFNPCTERLYETTISSSSPWPAPAFQHDFYTRFISGAGYSDKFKQYDDVMDAFNNGSITSVEAVRQFGQLDLIGQNFIQLNVVFKYQNPYIITDKPAMTPDSLLSSIGGALSLWLGMTVMFLFEVVEVIYIIIINWRRHTKQTNPPLGEV